MGGSSSRSPAKRTGRAATVAMWVTIVVVLMIHGGLKLLLILLGH